MKNTERQPVMVASLSLSHGKIEVRTRSELVTIDVYTDIITKLTRLCDGRTDESTIIKKVSKLSDDCPIDTIRDVLNDLFALEIVIDSRQYGEFFHRVSANPTAYFHHLTSDEIEEYRLEPRTNVIAGEWIQLPQTDTALVQSLKKRSSCRHFLNNVALSVETYAHILRCAYASDLAPVPSGGALFPLSIYLVVFNGTEELPRGLYQYNPANSNLIAFNKEYDEIEVAYAFNSETFLHGASGAIVVSADLQRQSGKYSNRGYRYTLIESGHVVQNILLASIEKDVSSLVYGGFGDQILSDLLELDERNETPVICVALGKIDGAIETDDASETFARLERKFVGKGKPINWVHVINREDDAATPFYSALAHYGPGKHQDARETYKSRLAAGTSESSDLAKVKAIAEAYERSRCGQPYVDIVSAADKLNTGWVDPSRYVPFTDKQLALNGFDAFSPDQEWQWVKGESASGETILVPVDMVFYPFRAEIDFGRKNCYSAHSNGVAAHTSLEEAKSRALHELIERDAIAKNWLLKTVPSKIPSALLPLHWRKRVAYWNNLGWEIDVIDFSHSGVAIVSVFAQSNDQLPAMSHGAAASSSSFDSAVAKAFHEMEVGLSVNRDRRLRRVDYDKVDTPANHGALYHFNDYSSELEYLFAGAEVDTTPHVGGINVLDQFNPVFITVSPPNSPLYVVRVVSDKLLPINFGYGRDHVAHHLVKDLVDQDVVPFPHYLA